MNDLLGSRIAGGNTGYRRVESDFYPTPPEATQALLDFLKLRQGTHIWEPACGEGHMVNIMCQNGYCVEGTDIQSGTDFLSAKIKTETEWIITNPPFRLSQQFIERCASFNVPFALLLKTQYWHASKRYELFNRITPSYVLPLTWRPDFLFKTRGGGSPLMDVIWCVWGFPAGHIGCTQYIPLKKPAQAGEGGGHVCLTSFRSH